MDLAESGGPADQVVGEDGALQPCRVRLEVSEGTWSSPAPSMTSRVASSTPAWWRWNASTGVIGQIGEERVVPPVGSNVLLAVGDEAGAAYDEAAGGLVATEYRSWESQSATWACPSGV